MGLLEWECTFCLCPIKSLRKLIVSYLLRTHNEYERLNNEIKHMYNETIQPPEANGILFLLGAEFARGRVCQGPRCPGIIRHRQRLCKFVSRIIPQRLFPFFFTASGFETTRISGNFRANNGYLYPPQTLFVGGILFSRSPSVRPSVRNALFP